MTITGSRLYPDADARAAIRDDLNDTLVVEAAAGTGKTTELVNRILRVVETGPDRIEQIVAVTFTEKAAGELKLRLREALEVRRGQTGDSAVQDRLDDALKSLEEAHVNTIHGFCAELIRERPVEACVDPLFTVLTEPQAGHLYTRAFQGWLQEALSRPSEGLRRALRRTSAPAFGGGDSDGPVDRLRQAGRALAEWREFSHPWRRPPFDRAAAIRAVLGQLHHLAALSSAPLSERDYLYLDTDAVRRLSRQIELESSFGQIDHDGWEARLVDLVRDRGVSRTRKGSGYKFSKDTNRTDVLAARDSLFTALQQFKKDADADLAACLQQELAGATERYQQLKAATGALDFADLLAKARELIKSNESVRRHLQAKFSRIFVDEFQDTDPVQADILLLLASDDARVSDPDEVRPRPGKLFIVGDPKQAIYRFRGTDVGTYWKVSRQIEAHGGRVLQLTTSYRAVRSIQHFVNAAFSRQMVENPDTLQSGYVALAKDRDDDPSQPAIVALPVPRPYGRRSFGVPKPSAKAIEESLPEAVAAFIATITDPDRGWTVAERSGSEVRVPLEPRHIAILFRRFVSFGEDLTREYVKAIEARGIPHLLVGGKAFHGREEVEAVRAALAAIEWPDDELSVFATLKGPLFAIDDEHLFEFRARFKRAFHPFRVPEELGGNSGQVLALSGDPIGHLMPIADALRLLQQLHRRRNYRPVADTIGRLLEETRAHVGFILRPAGEQALANVLHVAELARQYEAGGGISFRGFIDELRNAALATEAAEAPILEEGSDGVRLMTVHKAKGLEFPVVILADLTCRMNRTDASRYLDPPRGLCAIRLGGWAPHELHDHEAAEVDRDAAEGVRLAYVAAPRARDLLVVPAVGDEAWEGGWLSPLNTALYPSKESRRTSARGPKCPAFKSKDTVLERPNDDVAGPSTVCPGRHDFTDGYSVVWWDPSALTLGLKPSMGVRRDDLIVKDVPRDLVADGRTRYDAWKLARITAREQGARPSIRVQTVRECVTNMAAEPQSTQSVSSGMNLSAAAMHLRPRDQDGNRVGGAAFGTLVHAVLARTPFDATRVSLQEIAAGEARILGMEDSDATAAAEVVERALAHDLLVRARRATSRGACRRETPVTLTLDDGTLVEGVVDLAFEENGEWTVVDYKTDREIAAAGEDQYRRQVALYASAIARATGAPASGVLLRI
jgi:ATP-dependent exoDNAse (exonuclease V) beta subunit